MNLVNIMVVIGPLRIVLVGEDLHDLRFIRGLFEEAVRKVLGLPWGIYMPSYVGELVSLGEDRPNLGMKGATPAQIRAVFEEGVAAWEVTPEAPRGAWQWYTASYYAEEAVYRALCEYPEGSGRKVMLSSEERARIIREGDSTSDYYILPEEEGGRTEEGVLRRKVNIFSWRRLRPGFCPGCESAVEGCRCPPPAPQPVDDLLDLEF